MFLVWIESWTGFRVAPAPALLEADAVASWGSDDKPTKKRVRTDADRIVAVTFGLCVRVICMVTYLRKQSRDSR